MIGLPSDILKPGLRALYVTGLHKLLAPVSQGVGLIFMLHQVSPEKQAEFAPNAGLTVTPDYLDSVLKTVKKCGLDIVSLDEAHARLTAKDFSRRFACFTLDDGYRDNLNHAYPVFRAHKAPFTIYVPSDFPDGEGELWWVVLERAVAQSDHIEFSAADEQLSLRAVSVEEKHAAFERIYQVLRECSEDEQRAAVRALAKSCGIDIKAVCSELIMTWNEISELADDPLVTIGAHTVAHYAMARLPEARALKEMVDGADRIAEKLGKRPEHFSFPYGDANSAGPRDFELAKKAGFKTAVTTRKGLLFDEHADYLTALPRVSLNGSYQSDVFTRLYLSGAPFALWNRFRKVNAA